MPTTPLPTKEWIYAELADRINYYAPLHAEMEIDEAYWRLDFRSRVAGLPKGYSVKLPPTAFAAVQTLVDHILLGETPTVKVFLPPGAHRLSKKEQEHVELVRGWLRAFFRRAESRAAETPLRDFVGKAGGLGLGVLCYPLNWEEWPDEPEKKAGESKADHRRRLREWRQKRANAFPIALRSVHPLNCYPDPSHDPPLDNIEVRHKSMRQAAEVWPAVSGTKAPERKRKRVGFEDSKVEVEEVYYCSADWVAWYANGVPLLTEKDGANEDGVAPNETGIMFYSFARGGFGWADKDNTPESQIAGILRNGRDTLDVEAEAYNQINAVRALGAFGTYEVIGDDDDAATAAARKLVLGPGEVWAHERGIVGQPLNGPSVPEVVLQQLGIIGNFVEMTFGSKTLRGVSDGAGAPASRYRTQLAEARLQFGALKQSCEQAVDRFANFVLTMLRNNPEEFKDGLSVWGGNDEGYLTLKPEQVPPGIIVKMSFMPPTGEEKSFLMQEGLQLVKEGKISDSRFLSEYAGVDDPLSELKAMAKDTLRRKATEYAAGLMLDVLKKRVEARIPGIAAPPVPQPQLAPPVPAAPPQGGAPVPSVGPGGFTLPGEQGVDPLLAGTQDMMSAQGGGPQGFRAPQVAGAGP